MELARWVVLGIKLQQFRILALYTIISSNTELKLRERLSLKIEGFNY